MQLNNQEPTTPFYKEPFVLLILAIPLAAILWGGVMLKLAFSGKDSLVSDSYYKDGVSYTDNQELIQNARVFNIKANITFDEHEVLLTLTGSMQQAPDFLQLQLIHPTLEERDVTVFMQRLADGRYGGVNEVEINEKRHIWLSSPEQHWRISTTETVTPHQFVQLSAR